MQARLLSTLALCCTLCCSMLGLAAEPRITSALQPFVDQGQLAGAVTVVATKDKVLSVDTVGFADVFARQPIKDDQPVLDRLHVEADHRRGPDGSGG